MNSKSWFKIFTLMLEFYKTWKGKRNGIQTTNETKSKQEALQQNGTEVKRS